MSCINREEAIRLIMEYQGGAMDKPTAKKVLEEMPSAQPEQQWIPCEKKPPEEGRYLVWMSFAPTEREITVAEYCGGYWNIKTPIAAWMPLPEPYKEGE